MILKVDKRVIKKRNIIGCITKFVYYQINNLMNIITDSSILSFKYNFENDIKYYNVSYKVISWL